MLNTDNFTTFLPIFPFQILSEVREKSESFEEFFQRQKYFFQNLCWGHPIGQFVIFLNLPVFAYGLKLANSQRLENSKI